VPADALRLVALQAQLDAGEVGDGAADPDEGVERRPAGPAAAWKASLVAQRVESSSTRDPSE
jgi:hypothetical protein